MHSHSEGIPGEPKHPITRRKRKIISIPSVAASESGGAQTNLRVGVRGTIKYVTSQSKDVGKSAKEGDSPVGEKV